MVGFVARVDSINYSCLGYRQSLGKVMIGDSGLCVQEQLLQHAVPPGRQGGRGEGVHSEGEPQLMMAYHVCNHTDLTS